MGAFWSLQAHLPSVKSILPYFSSPSMVAISVSFPEVRNRKDTESGLGLLSLIEFNLIPFNLIEGMRLITGV